ncbi:uncharacterized protein LOC8083655 isoform X2 [Sorghum bicolor]|uniref:F-box domain-containing protein n=1 Tax=Sorghum bicolor TaxID=4558 RepID=A0A1Z5S9N6_SORBI|nr:uncharacterized protein LOC8083655 isoform X2 [Sorghum bicolor]OQU92627.1 hypothetical protein SORBI_3001G377900 [Sorghum bicolor]OQU92628.1 hypothetical protein SORBI_3001G377900 [Sorghum bicolor]OQU92631.1 hypothetical protein SORBI_3001G377900 [Sorghum bicolor]|eukprot:XP_021318948.1 uncharacterized protein LOC8083655 isoform X2 [Sorghum bicolor]
MAAELTSATTIDSLPVEMLTEVLLRVSTPADLVHAAAASRSWRGAIATPSFLARYRKRHKSSTFLGLYVPRQFAGPPSFLMPDSIRLGDDDAGNIKSAALRAFDFGEIRRYQDHRLHDAVDDAEFILGRLGVHPDCRLLDCHNSRLLLTRGDEALEVRSPLARESILLPFPPGVVHHCLKACLLQGHDKAAASFRVVCLQHRREGRNRQARAVEYDSRRKSWQDHPWETLKSNIEGTPKEVMQAGHRIFCKYRGLALAALLLDTSNMQFSVLPLPNHQNFVIGEIEDNVCCFVEAVGCVNHRLRVWQLDEEKLHWDLKKDIKMDQVLGEHVGYYSPRAISNGIVLVCSRTTHHHFVVDLKTCSMKEEFEFHGQSAYPMQMPWPPVFSDPTPNAAGGFARDGGPMSVGDARTGVGLSDDGGLAKLSVGDADAGAKTGGARESDEIDDPSPGLSVVGCVVTDPLPEVKKAWLLHSSSIACFVLGSSTAPPALMASTTASSPNCPHQVEVTLVQSQLKSAECQPVGRKYHILEEDTRHSRWEEFRKFASGDNATEECSNLLKRMELEASDNKDEIDMKDEAGLIHSSEAEELEEKEVVVAKNQKTKTSWGPIQRIPRPRRVLDDGKTELQRAQELKKVINLEKGRGPIQRIPRPRRVLDDGKTVLQRAQELKKVRNLEKAAGGFDRDGGPASMAMAPPAAPTAPTSGFGKLSTTWPEAGRFKRKQRKPRGYGPRRRNWKPEPMYLEAIFALRRRHLFSIASKDLTIKMK